MIINLIPEDNHPTHITGGAYMHNEDLHYDCKLDKNIQRVNLLHEIIEYKMPMLNHDYIDELAETLDALLASKPSDLTYIITKQSLIRCMAMLNDIFISDMAELIDEVLGKWEGQ